MYLKSHCVKFMVVTAGEAGADWRWAAWRMAVSCSNVMARVVGAVVGVGAEFPCGLGGGVVERRNTLSAAPGRRVNAVLGPSPTAPGGGGVGVDGTLSAVPGGGVVKIGNRSPVGPS